MSSTPNAYGKPVYGDGFAMPTDLQAAADFADTFANVRAGTAAARSGLMPGQLRDGMLFSETDTGRVYRLISGLWYLVFEDTGWVNITSFSNGFSSSTTPSETVRVRRLNGVTHLAGGLMRAAAPTTGVIAFGIPPGSRPGSQIRMPMRADLGMHVVLETNGAVTVTAATGQAGPAGAGYALGGISFIAEG